MESSSPIRSSDYVDTVRTISQLNEKVARLQALAGDWVLNSEVAVMKGPDGFGLKFTFKKANGTGFIESVSALDAEYFANDPDALVSAMVDKIFEKLFKEQIRNEITPFVARAVQNANALRAKS